MRNDEAYHSEFVNYYICRRPVSWLRAREKRGSLVAPIASAGAGTTPGSGDTWQSSKTDKSNAIIWHVSAVGLISRFHVWN